jgi:glycosyltransferase involved in cell wall biosynthesis
MKVALVSGSLPPAPCGVGAYTECLAESLLSHGIDAEIVDGDKWGLFAASCLHKRIRAISPDIVHLQYPTLGYGAGLAPHLLSVLDPGVVTLHEVRSTHIFRRLSVVAFAVSARQLVMTNEYEWRYVTRFAPWLRRRAWVIPVGSNVPAASVRHCERSSNDVIHFGLIRPDKGLDQVVQLARELRNRRSRLRVTIIGAVVPGWSDYFCHLQQSSVGLGINWRTGLSVVEVAQELSRSGVGYLPFPDGASERRGSLLALLAAGVATITTRGPETPASLSSAVRFASTASEAATIVERLSWDEEAARSVARAGQRYAKRFRWGRIAAMHASVYESVLRSRRVH